MKKLRTIKKNITSNKVLTEIELKQYNDRLIELKNLSEKEMKKKNYSKVLEYAHEIKKISKILKQYLKRAKENEKAAN